MQKIYLIQVRKPTKNKSELHKFEDAICVCLKRKSIQKYLITVFRLNTLIMHLFWNFTLDPIA